MEMPAPHSTTTPRSRTSSTKRSSIRSSRTVLAAIAASGINSYGYCISSSGRPRGAGQRIAHCRQPVAACRSGICNPRRFQQRSFPAAPAEHRHALAGIRRSHDEGGFRNQRDRGVHVVSPKCHAEGHPARRRETCAGSARGPSTRHVVRRGLPAALPRGRLRVGSRCGDLGGYLATQGHARLLQRSRARGLPVEGQQRATCSFCPRSTSFRPSDTRTWQSSPGTEA